MNKIVLAGYEVRTLFPGFEAKLIHTTRMTLAYVSVEAGSTLPEHQHPHEQVVNLLSGEFELVVNAERHRLTAGEAFAIPPNVKHSGTAQTRCEILDVFCPVREDLL
jgi:unsaturated pyranuronate lyase